MDASQGSQCQQQVVAGAVNITPSAQKQDPTQTSEDDKSEEKPQGDFVYTDVGSGMFQVNLKNTLKGSLNCCLGILLGTQGSFHSTQTAVKNMQLCKNLVQRGYSVYVGVLDQFGSDGQLNATKQPSQLDQQQCIKTFVTKLSQLSDPTSKLVLIVDSLTSYQVQTFLSNNREQLEKTRLLDGVVYIDSEGKHQQIQKEFKGPLFKMLARVAPTLLIPTPSSYLLQNESDQMASSQSVLPLSTCALLYDQSVALSCIPQQCLSHVPTIMIEKQHSPKVVLPWIKETDKQSKRVYLKDINADTVGRAVIEQVDKLLESSNALTCQKKRNAIDADGLIIKKLVIPWKIWLFRLLKAYLIRRCVISAIYLFFGLLIYLLARFTSRNPKKYNLKYVLLRWPVAFLRIFSALGDDVNGRDK